jgi:PAS domain S-box-containing protein
MNLFHVDFQPNCLYIISNIRYLFSAWMAGNKCKSERNKGNGRSTRNGSSIWLASSLKSKIHRRMLRQLAQGWERVSDAVSVTDPKTNSLWYVNPAWRQLYGYTFAQALDKLAKMLNLRDFSDKIQQTILIQTRKWKWSGRLPNKNSDDQVFPVDLRTSCLLDAEGEIMGLLGVVTPVRQYNISDESIQQLVERHQTVLVREIHSMLKTALITPTLGIMKIVKIVITGMVLMTVNPLPTLTG